MRITWARQFQKTVHIGKVNSTYIVGLDGETHLGLTKCTPLETADGWS